jgi:hypothetical protein
MRGKHGIAAGSVALVAAMLCLLPAGAVAAPGIDLTWGNDELKAQSRGDLFSFQPRGVAVNETSGDVYVSDAENNRVQRFTGSGAFISAWGKNVDAVNPSTGYEICTVAGDCKGGEAGSLGGELRAPAGIAIDQQSGDVYVVDTNNRRVQEFSAAGAFIRAFGLDVVQSGQPGDNPAASAKQSLTVTASSGKYTLEFEGQQTSELAAGATAAEVAAALAALPMIGAGNVEVSGASSPLTITFKGSLANNPEPAITAISGPGDPLGGGGAAVAVVTPGSSGSEICEAAASCKAGTNGAGAGAFGAFGTTAGPPNTGAGSGLAVAPAGAPNAGDVLVGDAGNQRLQEFSATGQFVRAFGWDVVAQGPDDDRAALANEFEVCAAAAFDACKAGSQGSGAGQFSAATPTRVAEDPAGHIYTVEPTGNFRVQRFALPANVPSPQGEFAPAALHGSVAKATEEKDNTSELAVDASGYVYAVKAFPTGTGLPPAAPEGSSGVKWQQRLLKLDSATGSVVETMAANPGSAILGELLANFEGASGLAVAAAGAPLYVTTAFSLATGTEERPRVWRLGPIAGLGASGIGTDAVGASTAKLVARVTPAAIPLGSAYRFEYSSDGVTWSRAPAADERIGNGSAGGESSACSPTEQAAVCNVSQEIAGLTPNTTYQLRLVLYTLFDRGQAKVLAGEAFTTAPAPPVIKNVRAHWSSPAATAPSLFLGGTLNPGHGVTTYYFQYVSEAGFQAAVKAAEESPADLAAAEEACAGDVDKAPCEEGRLREHGFDHAVAAPAVPGEAGRGLEDVPVAEVVTGLDPSIAYRYRLVATNPVQTSHSPDRLLQPPSAGERFYEFVSAGDSGGSGISDLSAVGDSGDRAAFGAQSFGDPRSEPSYLGGFIARRGSGGWDVADTAPEGARAAAARFAYAADLGARLWSVGPGSEFEQARSEGALVRAGIDGSLAEVAPLAPLAQSGRGHYTLNGASADLSLAIFSFEGLGAVALVPGEGLVANEKSNLYEASSADSGPAAIAIVNRSDGKGGGVLGGACGASLPDVPHAVSVNGTAVYFYAFPKAPGVGSGCNATGTRRLYERIGGEVTLEVSKSQCARVAPACQGEAELDGNDEFKGASADGRIAFFTSKRQLASSDEDESLDLYAYDRSPPAAQPNLVQVSAGETVGGHSAGSGAKLLGLIDNAEDGSRAYFVAEGVLSGANALGDSPAANKPNLYVYERDAAHPAGRIAFVGQLTAGEGAVGDTREWLGAQGEGAGLQSTALPVDGTGGGNGRKLVFVTKSKLLAEDTDATKDVYLYDDSTGDASKVVICLSCHGAPGAPAGAGNGEASARIEGRSTDPLADYAQQSRVATADLSTIVFASPEKLSGEDENDTWDAYAWREGEIELLTAGTGDFGIPGDSGRQVSISPSGRDVFFATRAALVGADTNNALDLYDARVGGGFPEAGRPQGCEGGEACQGPPPAAPAASSAGSEASGSGNPAAPPGPPRCPKGKVRKQGRCVKPHRHGKKKHHHRHHHHSHHHKRGGHR